MQRTAYEMRISDWSSDVCSSDLFTAAFSGSSRTARLAPATRLLAMKRPDVFVCVNGGNTKGLAVALTFAPTTIDLKNYWERVIEPIQLDDQQTIDIQRVARLHECLEIGRAPV